MSKVNDLATQKLAEDLANENWKIICTFLPAGWMEQARQSGALQRARGIPDAEKLLRLLLIHVVNGCSLTETAVRAGQLGLNVSAVAVFKRLQAAEEWLRWLAVQQLGTKRLRLQSHGRPLRAVDATAVSEPGSTGTDWKVHYSISLSDLRCDFFELTAIEGGGETLRRVPVHRGDIMMGDRIYANPVAVSHVVDAKGDILVRLNRQTLPLFDAAEKRIDLLRLFGRIKAGQVNEWVTRVHGRNGAWIVGRLIAVKRSAAATREVRKKLLRKASKRQETVTGESLRAAQYFAVWTTLTPEDFSAEEILGFYRLRWQIELAFKRMKSLLGLGHLPKKDPASARAWLHGKLFASLLVERMIEAANSISPWGYELETSAQPVERN
jgi:Transposase DDE domain